jgi:uncharacterized protein YjbI with pentapeptide repeats
MNDYLQIKMDLIAENYHQRQLDNNPQYKASFQLNEQKAKAENAKKAAEIAARQEVLETRQLNNHIRPEDYRIPTSVDELIERIDQGESYFEGCIFERAHFSGVDFELINFSHSKFYLSTFDENCNLQHAIFDECNLQQAKIKQKQIVFDHLDVENKKSNVYSASFENCEMMKCEIEFDANNIKGARFDNSRRDQWFQISREFSGYRFYFHFFFAIVYLVPIAIKMIGLSMLADSQIASIGDSGIALNDDNTVRIIEKLFIGDSVYLSVLTIVVLIYQVLRGICLYFVSPMVSDTEATTITPRYVDYEPFVSISNIVSKLTWLAIISAVVQVMLILSKQIML